MTGEELQRLVYVREVIATGRLNEKIREAHVTQSEVAHAVRVSPQAVCRWASGTRMPRTQAALRLADVLLALEHDPTFKLPPAPVVVGVEMGTSASHAAKQRAEIQRLRNLVEGYRVAHARLVDYLAAVSPNGEAPIVGDGEQEA